MFTCRLHQYLNIEPWGVGPGDFLKYDMHFENWNKKFVVCHKGVSIAVSHTILKDPPTSTNEDVIGLHCHTTSIAIPCLWDQNHPILILIDFPKFRRYELLISLVPELWVPTNIS